MQLRDINQSHLARRLGVSRQAINNIAMGYNYPSLNLAVGICRELNISLHYLCTLLGLDISDLPS